MKIRNLILLLLLIFFIYIILSHFFLIENLDVNNEQNPVVDHSQINADIESNNLIHTSSDEEYRKQYILDRVNGTFTKNEYDMLVRSQRRQPEKHQEITTPPVPIQDHNLNFTHELDKWRTIYYPEAIIGPNGIGLAPSILTKTGTDNYGFTFPRSYVQLQFMGYSKYKFHQTPFVCLQTALKLQTGSYMLKYNIQNRPNISLDIDSRSIGIMSMVNKISSPLFLFYRIDGSKKRVSFVNDETKLTPETLKFTISEEDAKHPTILSFIFIVTDPTITNNCTVALGDIEVINCEYNAC